MASPCIAFWSTATSVMVSPCVNIESWSKMVSLERSTCSSILRNQHHNVYCLCFIAAFHCARKPGSSGEKTHRHEQWANVRVRVCREFDKYLKKFYFFITFFITTLTSRLAASILHSGNFYVEMSVAEMLQHCCNMLKEHVAVTSHWHRSRSIMPEIPSFFPTSKYNRTQHKLLKHFLVFNSIIHLTGYPQE